MKKLSILVDMDNIIADIQPYWLGLYSEFVPDNKVYAEDVVDYDLTTMVRYPKVLLSLLDQPDFFYNLQPLPGVVKWFGELTKIADVSILTQPPLSNFGIADKKRWIQKHWPTFDLTKAGFFYEKYKVGADFLIDDSPKHLKMWKENNPNGKTITLDYAFSRNLHTDYRFDIETGWEQIYKTIKELSKL